MGSVSDKTTKILGAAASLYQMISSIGFPRDIRREERGGRRKGEREVETLARSVYKQRHSLLSKKEGTPASSYSTKRHLKLSN